MFLRRQRKGELVMRQPKVQVPYKILLVEDNSDHSQIAKKFIEEDSHFDVKVVKTAEECRRTINREKINLILLDFNLPDQNGLTVLRQLREENRKIPVILITGKGDEEIAVQAMKLGAYDYITKSANVYKTLLQTIQRALEQHQLREQQEIMQKELLSRNVELAALNHFAVIVNQSLTLDELFHQIEEKINTLLNARWSCIFLATAKSGELTLRFQWGLKNLAEKCEITLPGLTPQILLNLPGGEISENILKKLTPTLQHCLNTPPEAFQGIRLIAKNKVLGILFVGRKRFDQTEQTKIEAIRNQLAVGIEKALLFEEIRHLKEFNENIVHGMQEGVLIQSEQGRVIFVNPKMEKMLDYPTNEILDSPVDSFFAPEHLDAIREQEKNILNGQFVQYETQLKNRTGLSVPVMVSARLFGVNKMQTILAIYSDITELKKMEQKLIQTEKLSAMGQFISGIAHELNNPLSGVLGFSEMVKSRNQDKSIQNDLIIIHKEAIRCQNIVNQLLTFARSHRPLSRLLQINQCIEHMIVVTESQIRLEPIKIIKNLDPNLPQTYFDEYQLHQVLNNIISNARHAILQQETAGEIRISTSFRDEMIFIEIQDTGIGIPDENISRIFDPFFTTKEVNKGTGLGLSICYGIIREHHGELRVSSTVGVGSTFTLVIPHVTIGEAQPEKIKSDPQLRHARPGQNNRILVVDDEEVIVSLLSRVLSEDGFIVDNADNGFTALKQVQQQAYDLIISDIRMPKLDGKGFYESIRQFDNELAQRIIFTTGATVNEELKPFFEMLKNPILHKPFTIDQIRNTISNLIREKEF
jgi:two-component system NtrC family sensor kinase